MGKKLFTFALALLGCFTGAFAQWNTNANPVKLIDAMGHGDYYVCSPKFARTTDGKTWISYKIWESKTVNDTASIFLGTHTFLQLIDAEGKKVFDNPICVNPNYPTCTWWSDYALAVDKDGNAIVTVADSRSDKSEIYGTEADTAVYHSFQAAVYKVSQEGDMLWGLDGITYPKYQYAPYTNLAIIGDDVYFQFTDISDNNAGTYIERISPDGVPAWETPKRLYGQIVPSTGTDFLCFDESGDGVRVTRYTRDLDPVWETTYDSCFYGAHNLHPYKIAVDGEGGAAVAFVRNMGQFSHNIRLQHITADGETTFGLYGIDTYEPEEYDHDYAGIAVNTKNKEILVNWEDKLGTFTFTQTIGKYDFDGNRYWGNTGIHIAEKDSPSGYAFGTVGQAALADSSWIVVYNDVAGWGDMSLVIKRIDANGKQMWRKVIGRNIFVDEAQVFSDPEWTYVFWREESDGKEGIDVIRIHNTDGKFKSDGSTTGIREAEPAEASVAGYYSIDGKRLSTPQRGINIVKYTDGTTEKKVVR